MVFAQGQLETLEPPALAIVGARHATPSGADNAMQFAQALSRAGLVIVSGLAHGIDAAAHRGALEAGGLTLAVVGTGLDTVYPRDHAALAARIAETGLILSEYAPGTPAHAAHFPQRNRLIAGLSHGVLVVEAAVRSGSLITARLGIESGREVYAIPGSIHSPVARGCHALIRQGAKLVETAQDILEDLLPQLPADVASTAPSTAQAFGADPPTNAEAEACASASLAHPLLDAMGFDPITPEALATRSGLPYERILSELFELEMRAAVVRLPGGRYERGRGS